MQFCFCIFIICIAVEGGSERGRERETFRTLVASLLLLSVFGEACCIVLYFEAKAKVFLRFHVALCMAERGRGSQHCVA